MSSDDSYYEEEEEFGEEIIGDLNPIHQLFQILLDPGNLQNVDPAILEHFHIDFTQAGKQTKTFKISDELSELFSNCEKKLLSFKDFQNINDFADYIKSISSHTCDVSYDQPCLMGFCKECFKQEDSCMCLKCFFEGDHTGHECGVKRVDAGFCDCGNAEYIKPSGFCKQHQLKPEESGISALPEELQKIIQEVFSELLSIIKLEDNNEFGYLFNWLNPLLNTGSAITKIFDECFLKQIDIQNFFKNLLNHTETSLGVYVDLFPQFIMDEIFNYQIIPTLFSYLSYYIELLLNFTISTRTFKVFSKGFYVIIEQEVIKNYVERNIVDWEEIILSTYKQFIQSYNQIDYHIYSASNIGSILMYLPCFLKIPIKIESQQQKATHLLKELITLSLDSEFSTCIKREKGDKADDPTQKAFFNEDITFNLSLLIDTIKTPIFLKELLIHYCECLFKHIPKEKQNIEDYYVSVFSDDFSFSQLNFTSLLFGRLFFLMYKKDCKDQTDPLISINECKELVYNICKDLQYDPQLLIINLAIPIIKRLSAMRSCSFKWYVRNSDEFYHSIANWDRSRYAMFHSLLSLQTFLLLSPNMSQLFNVIAHNFGLFDENKDNDEDFNSHVSYMRLFFTHFVLSQAMDTQKIDNDKFYWYKKELIPSLIESSFPVSNLSSFFYDKLPTPRIINQIKDFTQIIPNKGNDTIKLTNIGEFTSYVHVISNNNILNGILEYTKKFKNQLLTVPKQHASSTLISEAFLKDNKCANAIIYDIFSDLINKSPMVNEINLNFIQTFLTLSIFSLSQPKETIEISCESLTDLIEKIPGDFSQFFYAKITYKGRKCASILDLLNEDKEKNKPVLEYWHLFENSSTSQDSTQSSKSKAAAAKAKMLEMMQSQQNQFLDKFDSLVESNDDLLEGEDVPLTCCICQKVEEKSVLCMPIRIENTQILEYMGEPSTINSRIIGCMHLLHKKCVNTKQYTCPQDRCQRNNFLPILHSNLESKSDIFDYEVESLKTFKSSLKHDISCYLETIVSLLEIQERSNPECLYNSSICNIIKNLFKLIYFDNQKPPADFAADIKPLCRLFMLLGFEEQPKAKFDEICHLVSDTITSNKEKYSFFRRVAIFENIVFNSSNDISKEAIQTKFNFIATEDLKPFTLNLPHCYTDLYKPPKFDPKWADMTKTIDYNIFTGEIMVDKEIDDKDLGTTPFIRLTSRSTTRVLIYQRNTGYFDTLDPIYLTDDGLPNIGLFEELTLFLNKEKVDKLIDYLFNPK